MSIRGSLTIECDQKGCHAEVVLEAEDADLVTDESGIDLKLFAADWHMDDNGAIWCEQCGSDDERDEAYERAAARARNNDFADTGGKDWT